MKWRALIVLSAAQFLMVLDQAVMNVSISQLVEDFDTTVTVIQGVITFYALTMAALMITGGKLGDRWGRKRAFAIGLIIYAAGSALTLLQCWPATSKKHAGMPSLSIRSLWRTPTRRPMR